MTLMISMFIDDTIDRVSTPFSGPRGDYAGAGRKEEYAETHRTLYIGYKKVHGIKMETILLLNGISTVFGGVSCRQSDTGVENMSGINSFLEYA